jgi:hypothetical protein
MADTGENPLTFESETKNDPDWTHSLRASTVPETGKKLTMPPQMLNKTLASHGPYVRIYDKLQSQQQDSKEKENVSSNSQQPLIDVSSHRKKLISNAYPNAIAVPENITRVVVGSVSSESESGFRGSNGSPPTLTLSRPTSTRIGPKYSRSISESSSKRQSQSAGLQNSPARPLLPFIQMTNALQLYLKFKVVDDNETIFAWSPGSFLKQRSILIEDNTPRFKSWFDKQKLVDEVQLKPSLHFPGYLLLTNRFVYVFRPLFRLVKLQEPLHDEQTTYINPEKLLKLCFKFPLDKLSRIDVGPGRQYLVFRSEEEAPNSKTLVPISVLFQTRCRQVTTNIIDNITTIFHENFDVNREGGIINQDTEWCIRGIQNSVLIRPGPKSTKILDYSSCWIHEGIIELTDTEFDEGIHEQITKVDFDYVQVYLFAGFIDFHKLTEHRITVGIQHVTLLASREYIYVMEERLDAWPPALFPPEFQPKHRPMKSLRDLPSKGFLIDKVPQFSLKGIGRIADITLVEIWRSWRIDSSFEPMVQNQFFGLGAALQKGHIGALNESKNSVNQQGTTSGWFWWVRVSFGNLHDFSQPTSPPKSLPKQGYWWDLVFETRDSINDFVEAIQKAAQRINDKSVITVIVGDD